MFKSTNRGRRTETEEIQFDVTKELRAEQKAFLSSCTDMRSGGSSQVGGGCEMPQEQI